MLICEPSDCVTVARIAIAPQTATRTIEASKAQVHSQWRMTKTQLKLLGGEKNHIKGNANLTQQAIVHPAVMGKAKISPKSSQTAKILFARQHVPAHSDHHCPGITILPDWGAFQKSCHNPICLVALCQLCLKHPAATLPGFCEKLAPNAKRTLRPSNCKAKSVNSTFHVMGQPVERIWSKAPR